MNTDTTTNEARDPDRHEANQTALQVAARLELSTCGELSCDECNAQREAAALSLRTLAADYAAAQPRQSAVEFGTPTGSGQSARARLESYIHPKDDKPHDEWVYSYIAAELAARADAAEAKLVVVTPSWDEVKEMSLQMVIQEFNNLRTRFESVEKERDQARARSGAKLRGFECLKEERDTLRDQLAASEAREKRMREALEWYDVKGHYCNARSREGDDARDALAKDIGQRARAALLAGEGEG